MNLDSLTATTGEWLRGTGPESDIVISTRIRLARNLASFPFTHRATQQQKAAARPTVWECGEKTLHEDPFSSSA